MEIFITLSLTGEVVDVSVGENWDLQDLKDFLYNLNHRHGQLLFRDEPLEDLRVLSRGDHILLDQSFPQEIDWDKLVHDLSSGADTSDLGKYRLGTKFRPLYFETLLGHIKSEQWTSQDLADVRSELQDFSWRGPLPHDYIRVLTIGKKFLIAGQVQDDFVILALDQTEYFDEIDDPDADYVWITSRKWSFLDNLGSEEGTSHISLKFPNPKPDRVKDILISLIQAWQGMESDSSIE